MWDRTEIASNFAALIVATALAALAVMPPQQSSGVGAAQPGPSVELSLEAAPPEPPSAPPPTPVEQAPPPPPSPQPEPPPVAEPPPPTPPPVEEAMRADNEPDKPEELLKDEDGDQAKKPQLPLPELSEASKLAVSKCLDKVARYPNTAEARRTRPRGTVVVMMVIKDREIIVSEVQQSSGSKILDPHARATVLKSGCGQAAEPGEWSGSYTINF
jgi:outer membrane biosynthesis protein TonB